MEDHDRTSQSASKISSPPCTGIYAISLIWAYTVLLSIVATSESRSSVTEEFHRVTVGVLMVYALRYAFDMFFNHFNIL